MNLAFKFQSPVAHVGSLSHTIMTIFVSLIFQSVCCKNSPMPLFISLKSGDFFSPPMFFSFSENVKFTKLKGA